jgi:putative transposase
MTRLPELAALKPRYGYRRLHFLVLRERRRINHKRVYRLYTKLGFIEEGRRARDIKRGPDDYVDTVMMYRFVK